MKKQHLLKEAYPQLLEISKEFGLQLQKVRDFQIAYAVFINRFYQFTDFLPE